MSHKKVIAIVVVFMVGLLAYFILTILPQLLVMK